MSKALANKKKIFRYKVDGPSELSSSFSDIKQYSSTQVEQSYIGIKESKSPHVSKIVVAVVLAAVVVVGTIAALVVVLSSKDESRDEATTAMPHSTEYLEKTTSGATQTTTSPATENNSYEWSLWGEWTHCTATCGTGTHTRYRHCREELSSLCLGDYVETELCPNISCPVYGKWTTWSSWGSCSVSCGGGLHNRTRTCNKVDALDKECSGDIFQQKTCSNWSCPDCQQHCTVGVLNERCDTCVCENNYTMGRILAKATGNPVTDAALYAKTAPTQLLTLSNSTGFFRLNATCSASELLVTKEGFIDTSVTVDGSYIEINLTRIVKPFLTETPQTKYRLPDENVTLCCKATANPEIRYYEWFKDNILLDRTLYKDETQLMLTYLGISDSGNYLCRANSDAGAIMSPVAALIVRDEPDDFCSDAMIQKSILLPNECMQPGSNTSAYEVGDCLDKKCRSNSTADNGTCREEITSCCSVKEYQVETIDCTGYQLDLFVVKSCGCAPCTPSKVTISGVATGLENGTPVRFASVYLNGEMKDDTSVTGSFEFTVNSTSSRWTITVEDDIYKDYLPASKVVEIVVDLHGVIHIEIKMIKASDPIEIDSTIVNTLRAGSSNGLNESSILLEIPANAFYYENGSKYSGNVEARLTFLDPLNISNTENIPGVFQYVDNEGMTGELVSLGVFNLFFEDKSGQPVVLGQVVDAYIPTENGKNETYENFKLWSLNSQTGIWEIEEENTKSRRKRRQTGDAWVSALADFSRRKWYNYDRVNLLTNNECYFKVRLSKDKQQTIIVYNLSSRLEIRTSILRGSTLHTIKHYTHYPKHYCFNVPCDDENAYITGRTDKQLFVGNPYPISGTRYSIYSSGTVLSIQLTSSSYGPFYSTRNLCESSFSHSNAYLSFSYGKTSYDWKFIGLPKKCNGQIIITDSRIRQRYWYPHNYAFGYRICFVKIKLHFNSGEDINKKDMKLRVFSYGGDEKKIIGIHESDITDLQTTYCIEYRCSGYIDTCDDNIFDYTKVKVILQYSKSILRCSVDDVGVGLPTTYNDTRFDQMSYQFSAPYMHVDSTKGVYSEYTHSTNSDFERAKDWSKGYCKNGDYDPTVKTKVNSGYAVSFYCE